MKTYLRILGFAKPFGFVPLYILSVVLYTVFESLNLGSIAPILNVLFLQTEAVDMVPQPDFSFTTQYVKDMLTWGNAWLINMPDKTDALVYLCILVMVTNLLTNFFRFLSRYLLAFVKGRMVKSIRVDMFEKMNRLPLSYFSNEKRGDIISRLTNDVQEVESSIIASLNGMVTEPFKIIFTFILLFLINAKLMLFSLLVLPASASIIGVITGKLRKRAKQGQTYLGHVLNTIDEALDGLKIVKSFNAQAIINAKFLKQNEQYEQSIRSMDIKKGMASPLSQFLGISVFSVVLFYGGSLVIEGTMNAGVFIAFLLLFGNVVSPLKAFYTNITSVQRGLVAGVRIFEVLDVPEESVTRGDNTSLKDFTSSIEFKDVCFKYEQQPVLNGVNLHIKAGQTVALVGPSGGGKSTMADLIPRFYDVEQGAILIDGVDVRDYNVHSLRGQIGIVTQDSILFNDTVFNNIAFGMPNATQEQVEAAAKIANAHEFIVRMSNGYQTEIGDRGIKLSGGQKQRLSIARAVLKNPPIMILDEATSALDTESEKLVQEALDKLMENRTSIVIAHRLSTIQEADLIVVIKDGRIVEQGTHASLIAANGVYTQLSKAQSI